MFHELRRSISILLVSAAISIIPQAAFCDEIKEMAPFTVRDRILILAPHPDDETINTSGVIQKALKAGASVKLACFTNGDNNEVSFIFYEKRLTFRRGEILHMGEVRRKESLDAMACLGGKKEDIIFLGYPDYGTLEILTKYWGKTKPFKTLLSRSKKVPYAECLSPGAPYVGESILADLKKVILDFKPTRIFLPNTADTNRDHRSLYLFTRVALWDLDSKIAQPKLYAYLTHVENWPMPRGYHPELELTPPDALSGITWEKLSMTPEEVARAHECAELYKSQTSFRSSYLYSFQRKNELFGAFPDIVLKKGAEGDIVWHDVDVPRDKSELAMTGVAYALKDNYLFVKVLADTERDKNLKINVFLLGYKKGTDFASMPKVRIIAEPYGMSAKDKKATFPTDNMSLMQKAKETILKIPLSDLADPDYIMTNVRASYLHMDETAWNIIAIEK